MKAKDIMTTVVITAAPSTEHVMTRDVVTVTEGTPVAEIAALLEKRGIKRVENNLAVPREIVRATYGAA